MSDRQVRSILYIENSESEHKFLSTILPSDSYQISIAKDGKTAFNLLKSEEFDLVVMGLDIPDMDEFEATRHIREDLKLSTDDLPIIAFGEGNLQNKYVQALEAGIDEIIAKPCDQTELIMTMETLLYPEGFDSFHDAKELFEKPQPTSPLIAMEQVESFISFVGLGRTKELLEEFVDDYEMRADKIFDIKTSRDQLDKELHAIASMSGNIGLQRFSVTCRDMMSVVKDTSDDVLMVQLADLNTLYEVSIEELQKTLHAIEHDS